MGVLTDVFVATRAEADDLGLEVGPAESLPTAQAKGLDPVVLSRLETALTGVPFEDLLPDLVGGYSRMDDAENGPWLSGVRPSLTAALAGLRVDEIPAISAQWVSAPELTHWSSQDGEWAVRELRQLAVTAKATRRDLYVWTSL